VTASNSGGSTTAGVVITVIANLTVTSLSSSINPSALGQTVTFTATVSGSGGTPTGAVTFKDGSTTLGTGMLSGGTATFPTSSLAVGNHSITAVYGGDSNFATSTSTTLTQVVAPTCADLFATATALPGMNGTIFGTNVGATGEVGEPVPTGASVPLHSVWCKWAAPANGSVTFDTTGSDFDTVLGVYTGGTVSALTLVASNDNISPNNHQSRVTFNATQGVTYNVVVDGAGAATGNYLLNWAQAAAGATTFAAVLPYARSITTGGTATAFGTIINGGSTLATACSLAEPPGFPGTFGYQTTNASNQLIGTPNTPVDIAPNAAQSYVFAVTPSQDLTAAEIAVLFACTNKPVTISVVGLNTFLLSASTTPSPDLVAVSATASHDQIVNVPGTNGTGFFSAAAINIGAAGTITATADDGGKGLAVNLTLCQTDPSTGACINPTSPGSSATLTIANNQTVTFSIFVTETGSVPFDPANNRLFLRLETGDGVTRGATDVAVRTVPP